MILNSLSIADSDPIAPLVNLRISQLHRIDTVVTDVDFPERNRVKVFLDNSACLFREEFFYGLRLAYQACENFKVNNRRLNELFRGKKLIVELMENKEIELLHTLPKVVEVYKVLTQCDWETGNFDLSWYLSEVTAKCPPSSKKIKGKIAERKLFCIRARKDIFIAILSNFGQREVLIDPSYLKSQNFHVVSRSL
jgi:hypothetical protein